ncbi:nuclear transport factor 2 family protein [Novosphingobium sp. BL-8H]|uniref:nuclear transport factor 2 family protein n=1 Tax=Novosphingobium sp. BL-8H TaxID=3127640 RepID=UPI003756BBD1
MDRLGQLEAIAEIRNLKAKYFRFMDCKLWDELPSVFTEDMRVVTPEGAIYSEGAHYAASLRHSLEASISCHQGLTSEIEILDADSAKGVWAMQDLITWHDRHPRQGWKSIVGQGHYHETYKREHGAWRIDTLTLTRLRLDIEWPADDPRSQP